MPYSSRCLSEDDGNHGALVPLEKRRSRVESREEVVSRKEVAGRRSMSRHVEERAVRSCSLLESHELTQPARSERAVDIPCGPAVRGDHGYPLAPMPHGGQCYAGPVVCTA